MATKAVDILKTCDKEGVRFLRLQFTDILGIIKNVEVPRSQFEKALDGEIQFDGSSIEGFTRIEESDMGLVPDLETFRIFPWSHTNGKVARLVCDIITPDGKAFAGCPRQTLKRQREKAKELGFTLMTGPEAEFFLFRRDASGTRSSTRTIRAATSTSLPSTGARTRGGTSSSLLEAMGFEVEAAHHEVAPGQHEIDFKYGDAVLTADNVTTFKLIVKKVAMDHGLHATFMPKPIFGVNGSGMHVHQSLMTGSGAGMKNAFFDAKAPYQLSKTALYYIGGVLKHAKAIAAVTNPLVNSYKRLVPGYEAPVNVAWSEKNRSPMVRIPARRGMGTRCEVRMPDPACNPYLAFAVMLAAGLDGIKNKIEAGEPVNENIFEMSEREKRRRKIEQLPANLSEALDFLEKDDVVKNALGEHIHQHFVEAKRAEWATYISRVHPWEVEEYLQAY
jgi:L-glutamine synthetase (EC 6.3.1.2)